jgi:nitric oxide reductase NorQ protein
MSEKVIRLVVEAADMLRKTPELTVGLSVRATDEVCTYLKHPLIAKNRTAFLPFIMRSSYCGRFSGHWNDNSTDAGIAWGLIQRFLSEKKLLD